MRFFRTLRLRLRSLLHGRRVDQDLDDELRDHLERQIDQYRHAGLSAAAARAAALREFGSVALVQEQCRDTRRVNVAGDALRDLRYAVRSMRRAPGYTAVAALSLALAIGANTSIFSLVDVLLLRDLPVAGPGELVELGRVTDNVAGSFSYPFYDRVRAETASFTGLLAMSRGTLEATFDGTPSPPLGRYVSGNFFATLGLAPAAGRLLAPGDDRAGAAPVAVIGYRLWQREFGGDPAIAGRTLRVESVPFTIVGVLPPAFEGLIVGRPDAFFVPIASEPRLRRASLMGARQANWLAIAGRLKPGVSPGRAAADAAVVFARELEDIVANSAGADARRIRAQRITVEPARTGLADSRRELARPALLLMGAVALVLLIACANVVNLLLTRGIARRGEIGLRLAMGASRGRLVRQLLTESAVLGAAGGAGGLAIATLGTRLIAAYIADGNPAIAFDIAPDGRVIAFTAVISLGSALLAGMVPALRAGRTDVTPQLRSDGQGPAAGHTAGAWTRLLIAAQVALSLLLLAGAALLMTTLRNLREFDAGFERSALVFRLDPQKGGYAGTRRLEYYRQILDRARRTPGVQAAGLSLITPAGGGGVDMSFRVDGQPRERDAVVYLNDISDGYLPAMGTRLLRGRDFGPQDTPESPPVAVINDVLARRYFKDEDPIGRHAWIGNRGRVEIVGVAANAKYLSLREQDHPTAYVHAFQGQDLWGLTLAVKAAGGPAPSPGWVSALRRNLQAVAPAVPVGEASTLAGLIERTLVKERLMTRILVAFAALALLLAAAGLYGVLGYAVTRRTHEIGLRLALGAARTEVLWSVLAESWKLVGLGVAIGVPSAVAFTRLLSALLYGVAPADARAIGGAVACLFIVGSIAALQPAWRAVRVDPLVALRYE